MIPNPPYKEQDVDSFRRTRRANDKPTHSGFIKLMLAIGCVVVWIALASASPSSSGPSYSAAKHTANHDAGMACIMAEKLIKQQLKSPSSARFDYGDCKGNATRSGDAWTLRSYVDADNSFGAHIRTRYVAKLTNVPPSDTWRLVELQLID